jgi:hypothetical protein
MHSERRSVDAVKDPPQSPADGVRKESSNMFTNTISAIWIHRWHGNARFALKWCHVSAPQKPGRHSGGDDIWGDITRDKKQPVIVLSGFSSR